MKQKLEAEKVAMQNLSMHTMRTSEDVNNQRGQLCLAIRMLLASGKTISAAHQKLQEANKLLSGKRGHGHLGNLQMMLRTRQQYMVTQVDTLYPVKALDEQTCWEKHDSVDKARNSITSLSPNVSKRPQSSPLTILGLQITALPLKKMSFFSDKKEVQMSATALGYVAHAILLIASYLDVPLRYSLHLGGSRSYIHDYAPLVESLSLDLSANLNVTGMSMKPAEFPLFLEGQDTTSSICYIFAE